MSKNGYRLSGVLAAALVAASGAANAGFAGKTVTSD